MVPDTPDQKQAKRFGHYLLLHRIGRGGMGTVYLAEHAATHERVALKVCVALLDDVPDEEIEERFFREIRAATALSHPNLCRVIEHGIVDALPYYTMPFLEGETLTRWQRGPQPLRGRAAVGFVVRLARAMQYAHEHGVVHRDLKPSNIMLVNGEPVILDFGLARLEGCTQLTISGQVLGTPQYMSPEQASRANTAVGRPSDTYSLGVILYELLSGHLPYEGSSFQVIAQVADVKTPPRPLRQVCPGLSEPLCAICHRAIAKRPEDRYPSMSALADALEDYLQTPPARGPGPTTAEAGETQLTGSISSLVPCLTEGLPARSPGEIVDIVVPGGAVLASSGAHPVRS